MSKVVGRSDDMLIIRGVNVFPTQIEEQVLRCEALAPHFAIEVSRSNRMDEGKVRVECRPGVGSVEREAQARLLAGYLKDVIGITAVVTVKSSGVIPRSTGKAARVTDLRPSA